jgi:tetratricopeptide (TPR) repeat protein
MSQTQPSPPNVKNAFLSREVRVFISSTFKDMEVERNYLLGTIFPEIAQACRERGVGFTEIDLRWGVTEEEVKNGRAVEICLQEIDRCREYPPFFLGLLGERYGWIPTHEELTHYWAEHADSPYALRIKTALEQGIGVTELEMQYGILDNPHNTDHARVFLRSAEFSEQIAKQSVWGNEFFEDPTQQQGKLKDKLREKQLVALDGYNSVEELGAAIKAFMLPQIEHLYPKAQAPTRPQQRDNDHAFYAASRRKGYVALPSTRSKVLEFIEKATGQSSAEHHAAQCLLIHGASGRGKTAFIADLELELSKQQIFWEHTHYLGADGDLSLNGWLDRLSSALQASGKLSQPLPEKIQDRWEILPTALFEVQTDLNQPMVLLLDAFDQCNEPDAADRLRALSTALPPQVCLLITVTHDKKPDLPQAQVLALPELDTEQRKAAIDAFLDNYGKNIPDKILDSLVHSERCAEPLFLRLLLEELRLHAQHETLETLSQTLLQCADAGMLFRRALKGMDGDFANARHPELATRTAHLLAASYRGLRKTELAQLLGQAGDPIDPASQKPRLPDAIFGPLLARLDPYSLRNVGRSFIMHAILRNALLDQTSTTRIRHELISHFNGDESESICERIFQRMNLGDDIALADELTLPNTISIRKYDDRLLQGAFSQLKASETQASPAIQRIMQHWREEMQQIAPINSEIISRINRLSTWLSNQSFIKINHALLVFAESKLSIAQAYPRPQITTKNNLAMSHRMQGQIDAAEKLNNECIDDLDRMGISDFDLQRAVFLNNYATIHLDRKRFDKALPILEEVLKIRRITHTYTDDSYLDQRNVVISLNNLGICLYELKNLDRAENCCNESLTIAESLPDSNKLVADALNNLGRIYEDKNLFDKAENSFKKSLTIARSLYPKNHPDVAGSLNNIAYFYLDQNRFKEASELYEELLPIVSVCHDIDYPDVVDVVFNLAYAYSNLSSFEKAIESLEKGLRILELISMLQPENSCGLYAYDYPSKKIDKRLGEFLSATIAEIEKVAEINFYKNKFKEAYCLYIKVFSLQLEYLPNVYEFHKMNLEVLSEICKKWVKSEPELKGEIKGNFDNLIYEYMTNYHNIAQNLYSK